MLAIIIDKIPIIFWIQFKIAFSTLTYLRSINSIGTFFFSKTNQLNQLTERGKHQILGLLFELVKGKTVDDFNQHWSTYSAPLPPPIYNFDSKWCGVHGCYGQLSFLVWSLSRLICKPVLPIAWMVSCNSFSTLKFCWMRAMRNRNLFNVQYYNRWEIFIFFNFYIYLFYLCCFFLFIRLTQWFSNSFRNSRDFV